MVDEMTHHVRNDPPRGKEARDVGHHRGNDGRDRHGVILTCSSLGDASGAVNHHW